MCEKISVDQNLSAKLIVKCNAGLHARPAAKIAAIANNAQDLVWIEAKGCVADACSIMDILALACLNGTPICVCIKNPVDKPILSKIAAFFESGFEGIV